MSARVPETTVCPWSDDAAKFYAQMMTMKKVDAAAIEAAVHAVA